jgi:proteic killer suppression protein
MQIIFRDERVALIETANAGASGYSIAIIKSARRKLAFIRAAPDERTLRNWRSLHYEQLKGRGEERSIRLNDQWRLIFTIDTECQPNKVMVMGIEDYH